MIMPKKSLLWKDCALLIFIFLDSGCCNQSLRYAERHSKTDKNCRDRIEENSKYSDNYHGEWAQREESKTICYKDCAIFIVFSLKN